jgi:hypothetical protein
VTAGMGFAGARTPDGAQNPEDQNPENQNPEGRDGANRDGEGRDEDCRDMRRRSSGEPRCPDRCPACGRPLEIVEVHGHGQCRFCGTNIAPCCQGGPTDG